MIQVDTLFTEVVNRGMAGGGLVFLETDEAEHKFYNDTVLRDAPRDPPPPPRC